MNYPTPNYLPNSNAMANAAVCVERNTLGLSLSQLHEHLDTLLAHVGELEKRLGPVLEQDFPMDPEKEPCPKPKLPDYLSAVDGAKDKATCAIRMLTHLNKRLAL